MIQVVRSFKLRTTVFFSKIITLRGFQTLVGFFKINYLISFSINFDRSGSVGIAGIL